MRPAIKRIILMIGYYTGIFEFVRWWHSRQGKVPILVYHRIVHEADPAKAGSSFTLRGLTVSAYSFDRQMEYLKRKYQLISLSEYIKRKKSQADLANCAVLTFDDGFKDFLTLAWPILKKYQVPVTVFYPSGFLTAVNWQHQLYYILDEAAQKKITVTIGSENILLDLSQNHKKYQAIRKLINVIGKLSPPGRQEAIISLSKAIGSKRLLAPEEIYLTETDLKSLVSEGIELGAHSVSHSHMENLGEQQLDNEIAESLDFIRKLTGRQEIAFALPFSTGSDQVFNKLKEYHGLCSFGNSAGLNTVTEDIFRLKRIAALDFSLAEFIYNISGTGTGLSQFWKG